jgi:hypothetical protein
LKSDLAPIVLFVYNRPLHTQRVLDALVLNNEAKDTILYIYSDGPKEESTPENLIANVETRNIIRQENRFKQIIIIEHENNKGLANSIIDGVTEVLTIHESVIVLEDDILVSRGFLSYMNNALFFYENEEKVGCIHSWNYNLDTTNYLASTFFLRGADCWGWATWRRAWKLFNSNGSQLLNKIIESNAVFEFDRKGTHKFTQMLMDNVNNKNNSWAIRWHASLFLENKFCLQPTKSIVKNIGFDGSGSHCSADDLLQNDTTDYITLQEIEIIESIWFFGAYKKYSKKKYFNDLFKPWKKSKEYLNRLLRL